MVVGTRVITGMRWSWFRSVGVGCAVVVGVVLVWITRGELGMTWDEPYFFERQHEIGAWFGDLAGSHEARTRALSSMGLERSWRVARAVPDQHGPIPELLSLVTGQALGWLVGPLRAYRLATVLVFAVASATLARLVGSRWGNWAAWAAVGSLVFNPRLFADAQQITADVDTGAFWFLAAVALLRSVETGRRPWLFGFWAALAIMCKATGVLLFPALLTWALIHRPKGWWRPFGWSILVVPLVMVVVMPPWWTNPVGGITRWVGAFVAYPQKVPVLYLGTVYNSITTFLPWHNTIVLTATMVPLGLLGLATIGVTVGLRPRLRREAEFANSGIASDPPAAVLTDRAVVSWAAINFATWMVLRMFPGLPAHDGIRQLVPSFFFLPVLAGYGAAWLVHRSSRVGAILGRALVVGCIAAAGWSTLSFHPYELAYYNALIGGPPGAKRAGMESTYYWDSATKDVLDWMNQNLPMRSTVMIYPPSNVLTLGWEQRWGRIRDDLNLVNMDPPHFNERLALMLGKDPCFIIFQMRQGLYVKNKAATPGPFVRLAESPATFELAPPRVGVRLLAIFSQQDFRRMLDSLDTAAR